jgi:hypothetical protein
MAAASKLLRNVQEVCGTIRILSYKASVNNRQAFREISLAGVYEFFKLFYTAYTVIHKVNHAGTADFGQPASGYLPR